MAVRKVGGTADACLLVSCALPRALHLRGGAMPRKANLKARRHGWIGRGKKQQQKQKAEFVATYQ